MQLRITFIGSLWKKFIVRGLSRFIVELFCFSFKKEQKKRINFGWSIAIHESFMTHILLYNKLGLDPLKI